MVSITRVEVSADLSYVTIYITALMEPAKGLAFLDSRTKDLQRRLGALETHKTPKLRFRIDKTAEEGSRIDALIERASKNTAEDSSTSSQ